MAYCTQVIAGIPSSCEGSKGGVKSVYVALYQDDIFTEAQGTITGVSSAVTWYAYNFKPNTASFTSTLTKDAANGVSYVATDLNLVFSRMDTAKRIEMNALSLADLAVIVVDSNGEIFALGTEEPVVATEGTGETGTQKTDGNRYTITLQDNADGFPPLLTKEAFDSITIAE